VRERIATSRPRSPKSLPSVSIRQARREDVEALLDHLERVAEERRWITAEPPIDRDGERIQFIEMCEGETGLTLLAEAADEVVGELVALRRRYGTASVGMSVAHAWRGQGVGSALMDACIDWARKDGVHKLELQVFPHNDAALALYRKFGFEQEGYLRQHYRRQNGEFWDAIVMGLLLDES
jgi:RimJ/RimL family protein N-acetyltransferase